MTGRPAGNVRLIIFLIVAGGLSLLLVLYTLGHQKPEIPTDAEHLRSLDPPACLQCHGPAGRKPRSKNHPLNDQCFDCHQRA